MTPSRLAQLGSRACSASMKAATPPVFWQLAMMCRVSVVLPDDSGPKISSTRPLGTPTPPRAMSSERDPVGMPSMLVRGGPVELHDGSLAELLLESAGRPGPAPSRGPGPGPLALGLGGLAGHVALEGVLLLCLVVASHGTPPSRRVSGSAGVCGGRARGTGGHQGLATGARVVPNDRRAMARPGEGSSPAHPQLNMTAVTKPSWFSVCLG